jgi:hypothetical protein
MSFAAKYPAGLVARQFDPSNDRTEVAISRSPSDMAKLEPVARLWLCSLF